MKQTIYTALVLLSLASCEKDVNINVPKPDPKIVMNTILNTNNLFRVTIGKSTYILTPGTNSAAYELNTAFVQLLVNGVVRDTLIYNASNGLYNPKNNTRALLGNTYTIQASAAGFATAESTTSTPDVVPIVSISRRPNAKTDAQGVTYDEIKFTFNDNSSKEDYYLVKFRAPQFYSGNTVNYNQIYCIKSNDKDIDRRAGTDPTDFEACIDGEFLVSDKNFNGQQKEIIVYISSGSLTPLFNPNNGRTYKAVVELHHITQDHYRYRKSFTTYQDAEDNPFAEPVLVYGNVKNGYGIVSVFNLTRDTIR